AVVGDARHRRRDLCLASPPAQYHARGRPASRLRTSALQWSMALRDPTSARSVSCRGRARKAPCLLLSAAGPAPVSDLARVVAAIVSSALLIALAAHAGEPWNGLAWLAFAPWFAVQRRISLR